MNWRDPGRVAPNWGRKFTRWRRWAAARLSEVTEASRVEPAIPERPTVDGLAEVWVTRWERDGVYRFDRTRPRPGRLRLGSCGRWRCSSRRSGRNCTRQRLTGAGGAVVDERGQRVEPVAAFERRLGPQLSEWAVMRVAFDDRRNIRSDPTLLAP